MVHHVSPEKIKELLDDEENRHYGVRIKLSPLEIEEWTKNGNFTYLRKELRSIEKLYYSCTINLGDRSGRIHNYLFVTPSETFKDRLYLFIEYLYSTNEHEPLVKFNPEDHFPFGHSSGSNSNFTAGTSNPSCALF